jgi:hypothetical protein
VQQGDHNDGVDKIAEASNRPVPNWPPIDEVDQKQYVWASAFRIR